MSTLFFSKYQGAGNDFILIDDRALFFHHSVKFLCDRKFGIGADGVILLQSDSVADFRMRIFNCDGGEAESCGNGLRCLMKFLLDLGLPKQAYRIATGDRVVVADFIGDQVSVEMGAPQDVRELQIEGVQVHSLNTGVPHAVLFVPDVQKVDVGREGAILRHHPLFQPQGTNVNFAELRKDGALHVRTFERGLEGESVACGTGAAAVGFIASQMDRIQRPMKVCFPGGQMEISVSGGIVKMVGEAVKVFEGVVFCA